jgi:hypothetical protein
VDDHEHVSQTFSHDILDFQQTIDYETWVYNINPRHGYDITYERQAQIDRPIDDLLDFIQRRIKE